MEQRGREGGKEERGERPRGKRKREGGVEEKEREIC